MNSPGGSLPVGDRVDDQAWAESDIPTSKDARRGRHQRLPIDLQRPARSELQAILRLHPAQFAHLTDGDDNAVTLPGTLGAGDELRIEAAALIEGSGNIQGLDLERRALAGPYSLGRKMGVHQHTFSLGLLDFDRIG